MSSEVKQNTVSVIVPVYNGGDKFRECLASLSRLDPPPLEVIVVADGDTDGSWQVAQEFSFLVMRFPENGGPARARNLGAQVAQGEIIFFIDADVAVPTDLILKLGNCFQDPNPAAAVIGSYDDDPGEPNFLSQYKNLFHHFVHQRSSARATTFWSGCGAIRRKVFFELQAFDEAYDLPCVEDIELGYRLGEAGYAIKLCKDLQVKHLKRWTPKALIITDLFARAVPWTELLCRHGHLHNDLNLSRGSRASVTLVFLALLAMLLMPWSAAAWLGVAGTLAALVLINLPLYRFFLRKRGLWFTLKALPWTWLYYLYSGVGFIIGVWRFARSRLRSGWRSLFTRQGAPAA